MYPPNHDLAKAIDADRRETAARRALVTLSRAGSPPRNLVAPAHKPPLAGRLWRRLAGGLHAPAASK